MLRRSGPSRAASVHGADFLTSGRNPVAAAATTGYCMKCKAQREIKGAKQITMKNGRPATEGTCPVCGTKIFKIGGGAAVASTSSSSSKAKAKS